MPVPWLLAVVSTHAADLAFTEADGTLRVRFSATAGDFEGRARAFSGTLSTDSGAGSLVVPVEALTTGLGPRDSRMYAWCLESQRWPEIRFALERIRGKGVLGGAGSGSAVLLGSLTVRDVTRPVEVPVTWAWEGPNLHLKGEYAMDWTLWNVPDPSVVLSTLAPGVRVDFDVVAKP